MKFTQKTTEIEPLPNIPNIPTEPIVTPFPPEINPIIEKPIRKTNPEIKPSSRFIFQWINKLL